ncbi:MAG: type 4a pilus biogenesis protein PilO [Phycisphaerae bacterium]|nr:type 4a pilus biogenesis protein PilO [Phycisphaerae bacterium]
MHPKPIHFAAGWLLIALIGGAALVVPPAKAMGRIRREVRALNEELAKPADGPEVFERLTADLERLREFGKGRMTPIPRDSNVAGLMGMLSETLNDLGLNQRDITTRPPKSHGDAMSMPVTIVLNGPFTAVAQAISRIEMMPRLVRVERLRVTTELPKKPGPSEAGAERRGIVRAEFSIDAFYAPDATPTTSEKSQAGSVVGDRTGGSGGARP